MTSPRPRLRPDPPIGAEYCDHGVKVVWLNDETSNPYGGNSRTGVVKCPECYAEMVRRREAAT